MENGVIQEIKRFILQADLTDQEKISSLLKEYSDQVNAYNLLCEHIRELIKNRMIEELEAYLKGLEPPLQEQYKELCQPEVNEFLDAAELYGFERPRVDKVFKDIGAAILGNMGLKPLLVRYRQIARSNDIPEKLRVIRQILSLNPEDASTWEKNLLDYEEELKTQLENAAKDSIVSKDFERLRQVKESIMSEPWKNPFREKVIEKIEKVLAEEELRLKQKNCEQLLELLESTLSQPGKYNASASAMSRINEIFMSANVQLSPEKQAKLQVLSAEFEKQRSKKEAEENYARLMYEIDQLMSKNAPLEQVESTFYELQKTRKEIPELTRNRVEAYHQSMLMMQKRKRMLALILGAISIALILVLGVFSFTKASQARTRREYATKLEASINDVASLSDAGFEILKEIEEKVPFIRESETITSLVEKLNDKRKNEEERRLRFKKLHLELSRMLENYSENASDIVARIKEIQDVALTEHNKELEDLIQLHDERRRKYVRAQDLLYRKLCGEAGDAYVSMKALIAKDSMDLAKKCLPLIQAKLQEAGKVKDVSFDAQNSMKNLVAEYAEAEATLTHAIADNAVGKLLKEFNDGFSLMKEQLAKGNLDLAKECVPRIQSKLQEAEGIADVSIRTKNELKKATEEFANASKLIEQGVIDYSANKELKKLEEKIQALGEMVAEQEPDRAKKIMDEITSTYEKKVTDSIANASIALKERFETCKKLLAENKKKLEELPDLMKRQRSALSGVIGGGTLETIPSRLDKFQEEFPGFNDMKGLVALKKDIFFALSGDFGDYDRRLKEKEKTVEESIRKLGEVALGALSRQAAEYKAAPPMYMVSVQNTQTKNIVDFYMQTDNTYRLLGDVVVRRMNNQISLKNVLGMESKHSLVNLDFRNYAAAIGGKTPFSMSLAYPSNRIILENIDAKANDPSYLRGHYGEWILSFSREDFDMNDAKGWSQLDRMAFKLFGHREDSVRIVYKWREFLELVLSQKSMYEVNDLFEVEELKTQLRDINAMLALLPENHNWYSVTWEHGMKLFLSKYGDFRLSLLSNGFEHIHQQAMRQVYLATRKLVPFGIMYRRKGDSEWYLSRKDRNLPEGDYPLYILDSETKAGLVVGEVHLQSGNNTWRSQNVPEKQNFYVVYVRK